MSERLENETDAEHFQRHIEIGELTKQEAFDLAASQCTEATFVLEDESIFRVKLG